jgi:hypothetical protein
MKGVVVHICNPSTQKTDDAGLSLRPAWTISETLSQNQNTARH